MEVGAKFKNVQQLRFCLKQHAIRRNFNCDLDKNDLKRVVVKCLEEGCGWKLRAKKMFDVETMKKSQKLNPSTHVKM